MKIASRRCLDYFEISGCIFMKEIPNLTLQ